MTPMTSTKRTPAPASPSRRTGLLVAGVLVLAAGVLAAAMLWFAAGRRSDDAIRGLARAPIGCDTTLNFAEPGTYVIFVETSGTLDDVDGTCRQDGEFASTDDVPALRVFFVDDAGTDLGIDLPRRTDVGYSGAGAVGESIRSFDIESAGDYTLRVQSPGEGVAVAVGRDPSEGISLLKNLAALSAILGLIGGGVLLVLGVRRHDMAPAPDSAQWPSATPVTSPPGMGAPIRPTTTVWQPAVGPPSTLRPPDQSPIPTRGWAAPTPAAAPPPDQWAQPETTSDDQSSPVAPQPPQRAQPRAAAPSPTEIDDSSWAPPLE